MISVLSSFIIPNERIIFDEFWTGKCRGAIQIFNPASESDASFRKELAIEASDQKLTMVLGTRWNNRFTL